MIACACAFDPDVRDALERDDTWTDADGVEHDIPAMSTEHLRGALAHLHAYAEHWHLLGCDPFEHSDIPIDWWLHWLPVYRALRGELERRRAWP